MAASTSASVVKRPRPYLQGRQEGEKNKRGGAVDDSVMSAGAHYSASVVKRPMPYLQGRREEDIIGGRGVQLMSGASHHPTTRDGIL